MAHCLRRADANKMVNSEWNMGLSGIMECPFTPVQEGNFFPDTPATALARENFKKTKILLGQSHKFLNAVEVEKCRADRIPCCHTILHAHSIIEYPNTIEF